jgi:hypothetical protein
MKNEVSIGRAGEFLVASIVETFGYRVVLCQQQGFDMLLIDGNDYYRCEVKATKGLAKDSSKRYAFTTSTGSKVKKPINPELVDIVCLVAIDLRKCWFVKTSKSGKVSTKVPFDLMAYNDEAEQLKEIIRRFKEDG